MDAKDAYMFPVIGSSVLFGLYALIKYFGKEIVNQVLLVYFLFACSLPIKGLIKTVSSDHPAVVALDEKKLPLFGNLDLKLIHI